METDSPSSLSKGDRARERILDATLDLIRTRGYAATRVSDVCEAAGLTKGGFFHHFSGKEELAVAAAEHWSKITGALFAEAPYHAPDDPLERLLSYVAFRRSLLQGAPPEFTCLAGTLLQETHATHPAIREACKQSIFGHADTLVADIEAAKAARCPEAEWSAESLALHTQAVLQGAFILAKAEGGPEVAAEMVRHLERYLRLLFPAIETPPDEKET